MHVSYAKVVCVKIRYASVLLFIAVFLSAGCSYFKDKGDVTENYTEDRLYAEAKGALDGGEYSKAVEYYEKLQARHPFGPHSQQAQLDLSYAYYKQDDFPSAVAAADRYIKLYPSGAGIDYAYYLKGLANFNQGKGLIDRYLPNDTTQRDQGAAAQAFQDFADMIKKYPDSQYVDDAKQRMIYLRNVLAQGEVNVATYYMRRGAYLAAANRARYVVENFQQSTAMPAALTIMAKAYKILGMNDLSNDSLRVLEENFPNHPGIEEVRETTLH